MVASSKFLFIALTPTNKNNPVSKKTNIFNGLHDFVDSLCVCMLNRKYVLFSHGKAG